MQRRRWENPKTTFSLHDVNIGSLVASCDVCSLDIFSWSFRTGEFGGGVNAWRSFTFDSIHRRAVIGMLHCPARSCVPPSRAFHLDSTTTLWLIDVPSVNLLVSNCFNYASAQSAVLGASQQRSDVLFYLDQVSQWTHTLSHLRGLGIFPLKLLLFLQRTNSVSKFPTHHLWR